MTTNKNFSFDIQMFNGYSIATSGTSALSIAGGSFILTDKNGDTVDKAYGLSSGGGASDAQSVVTNSAKWFSLAGGDSVAFTGVSSIKDAAAANALYLKLQNNNGTFAWSGLQGTASVALSGEAFSQTINSSKIDLVAGSTNGVLNLASSDGSSLGASIVGGGVKFNTVDRNWVVANGASVAIGTSGSAVTAGGNVTLNGATNRNYLDFTLGNSSGSLAIAGSLASLTADSIKFYGLGAGSLAKNSASSYTLYNTTALTDAATIGTAIANLGAGASAVISGTGSNASVVAISDLGTNGTWQLGDATNVTLGTTENWVFSTKNASLGSSTGTHANAATLASGTATLNNSGGITGGVQFNAGSWSFAGGAGGSATVAAFDANGGITSLKVAGTSAAITNAGESAAAIATGGADKLTLAASGAITLNGSANITKVDGGLAANSTWTAGASSITFGGASAAIATDDVKIDFATKSADSVYGVLTVDSVGTAVASVASLAGNATVTANGFSAALADTPFALNVMSKNWTIANATNGVVAFDTLGNASLNGGTVYVAGDDGAQVTVNGAALTSGSINGAQVAITSDTEVAFALETAGTGAGIASITGVDNGAVVNVSLDNSFAVATKYANYNVTTANTTDSVTSFTVEDASKAAARLVFNVEDKASYNVTGGKALFNLAAINGDVVDNSTSTSANSTTVTINGTAVEIKRANNEVASFESEDGDITAVTMKAGDALTTDGDKQFKVVIDTSDYSNTSTDTVVITVNDTKISIAGDVLNNAKSTNTTLNVDQSGDTAQVTITGGLATTADYSVTSGVYKVGQNSADTITDDTGYISVSSGTAVAENTSTKLINESLESAISSLAGDTVGTAINAYQAFYDLSKVPATVSSSATVANWENDDDSIPAAGEGSTGYNIFADTLTSAAKSVTLQANGSTTASAAIVVAKNESNSLANAVIDLSNSARTHQVIVGGASNSSVTANHTVIGSSAGDTIVFGDNATGSNVAKAGSGNTYLVNTTSSVKNKKSSLIGGAGDDTIVAGAGDYVEGGSGADFFKDSAAYQINDYSVEDGDIIIASKLSSLGIAKLEQLSLNGNVIQVNGGAKVTLGTDYDENNSMSAVIAGADGSTANAKYVAWASAYGSTVDASSRESAAIIVGAENEGAGDLLQGSAKNDTIYAGGNDSVLSGAGADYITLKSADTDNGELGAMVALAAGKNTVDGWNTGFDNETGDNILYHDGGAEGISLKSSSNLITAYGSEGSMTFAGTENYDYFNFLVGVPTDDDEDNGLDKVTFIKSGNTAYVSADSMVADVYYGEKKNGITFTSGVEKELNIDLGGDAYTNIVSVNAGNANAATIMGAEGSVKEFVTVSGAAENGAGKTVSLGGGNDLIVSAGTNVSTAGHTFQFGAGDGKDTITNFGFYQADDTEVESADLIQLSSFASVKGTGSKVEISTTSSDKVILTGATANDVIRVKIGGDDAAVYNVKVGNSSGTSTFTYADNAQLYYGNASKGKDVLNFSAESDKSVGVWLTKSLENSGFKDSNGNTYIGVGVVNASSLTSASATLVGADGANNILIGAGASSYTSLWGGIGGKNSLVGGVGEDTFVFFQGNGNNDTVSSYNSAQNDVVWLANISLNDIDLSKMSGDLGISTGKVEIVTNDGSKLTVNPTSTTATFRLSDGSEWVANTRTKTWGVA